MILFLRHNWVLSPIVRWRETSINPSFFHGYIAMDNDQFLDFLHDLPPQDGHQETAVFNVRLPEGIIGLRVCLYHESSLKTQQRYRFPDQFVLSATSCYHVFSALSLLSSCFLR